VRLHRHLIGVALALALLAAAGPVRAAEGDAANSDVTIAAYLDGWNGAAARFDTALAPGFIDRTTLLPLDAAMFRLLVSGWRAALPDLKVTLLERTSAPDREVLRLRFEGKPADSAALVPLSGGRVVIEQTEALTLSAGAIASRFATPDDWTLPTEWLFAAPPVEPLEPLPAVTIAQLGPGKFPESLAFAPDGTLYVSTGLDGTIVMIDGHGVVKPFARLAVGNGGFMMCLAFDAAGALYASVNSRDPAIHGVWRFDRQARAQRLSALPPGSAPNGIALDGRGHLLVADSFGGVIWRVPTDGGTAQVWLRHAWLTPRPLVGRFPGANGLQRAGDAVIVAVSDRSLLLRVPIAPDGAAGPPQVLASGIPGDDFAVAKDGTLYVATHPFNTIVRLTPDGRRGVIAGPAQGVVGPTSATIGPDGALYVASDGGFFRPLPGILPAASISRITLPADTRR
jgi:sugar lactone lactonase YvrE